jgi:RHS repeat-associated protein
LGDTPVATIRLSSCGLSIFYIHTDQLNTPRRITRRSTSDIVWRWDSDPFGAAAANENPSGFGTFSFNLRFAGQYFDAESGLNYNYFRGYDPPSGRYVEADPAGIKGGINPYTYVGGNPNNGIDPLGLCKVELRFKPVFGTKRIPVWHGYVITTDLSGAQSEFRGGPDLQMNAASKWGNITTESGPYTPESKDWSTESRPSMLLYEDAFSCACENQQFSSFLKAIQNGQFPYDPLLSNSNSTVGTMLRDLDYFVGPLPVVAPGFGINLH